MRTMACLTTHTEHQSATQITQRERDKSLAVCGYAACSQPASQPATTARWRRPSQASQLTAQHVLEKAQPDSSCTGEGQPANCAALEKAQPDSGEGQPANCAALEKAQPDSSCSGRPAEGPAKLSKIAQSSFCVAMYVVAKQHLTLYIHNTYTQYIPTRQRICLHTPCDTPIPHPSSRDTHTTPLIMYYTHTIM